VSLRDGLYRRVAFEYRDSELCCHLSMRRRSRQDTCDCPILEQRCERLQSESSQDVVLPIRSVLL
jgi:hypothetical protein